MGILSEGQKKRGRGWDIGKKGHRETTWGEWYFEILKIKSSIMHLSKIKSNPHPLKIK